MKSANKMYKLLWSTLLMVLLFLPHRREAYARKGQIEISIGDYEIYHYHDWTDSTLESRVSMMKEDMDPFSPTNQNAYIRIVNQRTGDTTIRPTIAIRNIYVDTTNGLLICVSDIWKNNPYQLVIYSLSVKLLGKAWITPYVAVLNQSQLEDFRRNNESVYNDLLTKERIVYSDRLWYIDYLGKTNSSEDSIAFKYFVEYTKHNANFPLLTHQLDGLISGFYDTNHPIERAQLSENKRTMSIWIRRTDGVIVQQDVLLNEK